MASEPGSGPASDEPLDILMGSPLLGPMIKSFSTSLAAVPSDTTPPSSDDDRGSLLLQLALAALDSFLQANVTGPVLPPGPTTQIEKQFTQAWKEAQEPSSSATLQSLRRACLDHLEVDGIAPYAYIPHLELFCLARHIISNILMGGSTKTSIVGVVPSSGSGDAKKHSLAWMRLRINGWHYKLLTQPSLGHGSNFTKSSQWSDVPTLAARILDGIDAVSTQILGEEVWAADEDDWNRHDKTMFLVEAANYHILLGRNDLAKDALQRAAQISHLQYALSGALGKRTKFQEKSTSQLVVLAKSSDAAETGNDEESAKPDALMLNNDTLLEDIHFTKEKDAGTATEETEKLPPALVDMAPDDQPQLNPLDQMILLTEATIKDSFSPIDGLTSEEILPYAVRVLADKSTNWQIYTQALLVRSRIEVHRSRTMERGILQLQAVADQVIADTTATTKSVPSNGAEPTSDVPAIQVTQPDQAPVADKPTTFFPAPKPSESAPAHVRLQYIHAISSPPRWHLESELAYAWASAGSLASAMDIFKRLRLWPEVALCLASWAAVEDEDGRGSGGEEKARGIIRWRLFHRTGVETPSADDADDDEDSIGDVTHLRPNDFTGPEREPPPPNAARLWCILGDLESSPAHYERAWVISKGRYSRAQRSLAEHYVQKRDWPRALEAYKMATAVNRLNPDMWSRLGDVNLGLGNFEEAAEAYSRAIGSASDAAGGEGAKTWSNLGSALWSLYREVMATRSKEDRKHVAGDTTDEPEYVSQATDKKVSREPAQLLAQSLSAYKRGAALAHDNWRIWDNVLTLSARIRPPAVPDMVLAMRNILRIRGTEDAVDVDVLSALMQDAVLSKDLPAGTDVLPRGSQERLLIRLVEEDVTPLITRRSELWTLVSRLRAWMRDYAGAIDAAERAWRAALGPSSSGLLSGATESVTVDLASDKDAWEMAVERTDELASMLENWGPDVQAIGAKWKSRVRSAVRSVMGRGKETWEGTEGWTRLEGILEGLRK